MGWQKLWKLELSVKEGAKGGVWEWHEVGGYTVGTREASLGEGGELS